MTFVRLIERITLVAGTLGIAALMVLSTYLAGHRPLRPNLELGLTCAYNYHGRVVYLTRGERLVVTILPWTGFGLFFTAIAIRANSRISGAASK